MTMLQLRSVLYNGSISSISRASYRFRQYLTTYSTNIASEANETAKEKAGIPIKNVQKIKLLSNQKMQLEKLKQNLQSPGKINIEIAEKIENSDSLDDLLNLVEIPELPREINIQILSIVTNWINSGNLDISSVTTDKRFQKLQNNINNANTRVNIIKEEDLSKYENMSTIKLIEVVEQLAARRSRPTPVLRCISEHIVKYSEKLNIKMCVKLLYALAVLHFPHVDLLEKISNDLIDNVEKINGHNISNIMIPIGLLRYRNEKLLQNIYNHMLSDSIPQKSNSWPTVLQTFAILGYTFDDSDIFAKEWQKKVDLQLLPKLKSKIDFIWSLVILNMVEKKHIMYLNKVLETVNVEEIDVGSQIKILNICAATKSLKLTPKSTVCIHQSVHNALKMSQTSKITEVLSETLSNVLGSRSNFEMNVDTNMGFIIDAECFMNSSFKPIPIEKVNKERLSNLVRIAILYHSYKDYCLGTSDLLGPVLLRKRLLADSGYHVVSVSHENFSAADKLVKRAIFLQKCFNHVKEQSSV